MRPIPVMLMAALAVVGCSAQAARDPAPALAAASSSAPSNTELASLNDSEWRFVELGGQSVSPDVTATLRLRDGRASGKAGCNAYGARYQVAADGSAEFKQTLSTKMACLQPAGVMRAEQGVFNAFRNTAKLAIVNGELVMLDAVGKPLAKLVQSSSP